jgi:hypothetical protein
MTTQSLRRQIDRIEQAIEVMTPKTLTIKILREPDPSAGGDSLLDFLLEAKRTNDLVFVVCFKPSDARAGQTIQGTRYFESDFAAMGASLMHQPSTQGNKNALEDLRDGVLGNIWRGNDGATPLRLVSAG